MVALKKLQCVPVHFLVPPWMIQMPFFACNFFNSIIEFLNSLFYKILFFKPMLVCQFVKFVDLQNFSLTYIIFFYIKLIRWFLITFLKTSEFSYDYLKTIFERKFKAATTQQFEHPENFWVFHNIHKNLFHKIFLLPLWIIQMPFFSCNE